jgi:ribonuclease inhibitor
MTTYEVDLTLAKSSEQLHELLEEAFGFPSYYGRNWDAFWDCIQEVKTGPWEIAIKGWEQLQTRLPHDARMLGEILADLQFKSPSLSVRFD